MSDSNNEIDFNLLVDNLSSDQQILHQIQDKELILFLGTTNSGKTTTICFFSDKSLTVKQDVMKDPEGNETLGDEVIDTIEPDNEFHIGHTCDSTTNSIHVCSLPNSNIILADSCGFQDTQGPATDIANAVSLRNAMKSSSSLRPVIIIDANIISVSRGIPFVKLLELLLRFFSPIQKFLSNMNFFFTHGRPDLTSDEINKNLVRLSNATHIKNDQNMKDIVNFLFSYVRKHSNRCVLLPADIASPIPDRVSMKRRDCLDLVLGTEPISQEMMTSLGCPISNEAQISLREKCKEIKISIIYYLGIYQYSHVQKQLHQLRLLHESLDLVFVTELFKDCHDQVSNHLNKLFESMDSNLQDKNYEQLCIDFTRCKDARCLPNEFEIEKEYKSRVFSLSKHLMEIGNKIFKGEDVKENGKWNIDCAALDDLKLINQHLNFVLLESQIKSHGYKAVIKWVEESITLVNERCRELLKNFKQIIISQSNQESKENNRENQESSSLLLSSLQVVLKLYPRFLPNNKYQNNNNENDNKNEIEIENDQVTLLSFPLFVLFQDIECLKSLPTLKKHISPQYVGLINQRVAELNETLHSAHTLIYGEKGFLESIEHLSLSNSESSKMTLLHNILQVCYSVGANDHVPCDLYDLPCMFVEETMKLLTLHLNHIDNCLINKQYIEMENQLRISLMVHLTDSTFSSFKSLNIENKVTLVKENIKKLFEDCFQQLNEIREKDVIECSEFTNAYKLMSLQRDCCCLDFLFEFNHQNNSIENSYYNNNNRFTPSYGFSTLYSIAENDWSTRVSQFLESFAGNNSPHIKQTFVRSFVLFSGKSLGKHCG